MKSTVDAREFTQALTKVISIAKRSKVPALEQAYIEFTGGICKITATDMATWLTAEIPAGGDAFSFIFSRTKQVAKACENFDGTLVMEYIKSTNPQHQWDRVNLHCGTRSGEFDTLSEDFPILPETEDDEVQFSTNAMALLERCCRVKYAVRKPSNDSTRAELTGIRMDGCRVVAVDGYRLACDTDAGLCVPKPFIIRMDAVEKLKAFGDTEITVSVGTRYLRVTNGRMTLLSHLLAPAALNIDGAIPKQFREEFSVSPKQFLRELSYLKNAAPKSDKLFINFHGGEMDMCVLNSKYCTRVEVDGVCSIPFSFNLYLMADALKQFEREAYIKMKISGELSPIILEAEGRSDFAMVLPMQRRKVQAA